MTTNHKELCERLRTEIEAFRKAGLNPGELVPALAHIEELELEREQAVAEAHGYRDRIAELEKERDALKADAERYVWSISSTDNAESLWAAVMSCGPSARESINIEIAAALQAEKETRS